MADKPSSISLSADDQKVIERIRKRLTKEHGPVSMTFIVRKAIRSLDKELA